MKDIAITIARDACPYCDGQRDPQYRTTPIRVGYSLWCHFNDEARGWPCKACLIWELLYRLEHDDEEA